jgi:chitodextrinase
VPLARPWIRPAIALMVITLLVYLGHAPPAHAALPQAPNSLPQFLGVEVEAKTFRLLDDRMLRRLRSARVVLVVTEGVLATRELRRLEQIADRSHLTVFAPSSVRDVAAGLSVCEHLKRAQPGGRCALRAPSARDAAALASTGRTDVVFARIPSARAFRRLPATARAGRIAGILDVSARSYRSARWRGAVAAARRSQGLDLVVSLRGVGGRRTLRSLLGNVTRLAPRGTPPSAPLNLTVAARSSTGVFMSWGASRDDEHVAAYGLFRDGAYVGASRVPSGRFEGLTCADHLVEVDAVDASGNRSAKAFAEVAPSACGPLSLPPPAGAPPPRRPGAVPPTPDVVAPSKPRDLRAAAVTETSVSLAWTASTDDVGVTGYRVLRDGSEAGFTSSTSATVSSLACGKSYAFGVEAMDAGSNRSPRAMLTASTRACRDTQAPSAPIRVTHSGSTDTSVSLVWQAARDDRGVTGYRLFRDGVSVTTTHELFYTFNGLECGRSYTFALEAHDAAGNASDRSRAMSIATTEACEPPPPPPPPPGTAHLWMDPDGGSCSRSEIPARYADEAACASIDEAYDASACGDTVYLKPGAYREGSPYVTGDRDCANGLQTVFESEPDGPRAELPFVATPPNEGSQGPDWIILRNLDFLPISPDGHFYTNSQQGVGFFEGTTRVTVEDVDMGSFFIIGASDITIRGSDIGPCEAVASPQIQCSNNKIAYSDDPDHRTERIVIENNLIHDFRYGPSCWDEGADCHWESVFINSAKDYTLRRNKFSECSNSGCVYVTLFDGPDFGNDGLLIENNWFEMSHREDSFRSMSDRKPVAVSLGHCEGFEGDDYNDVFVRFNSFSTGAQINHAGNEENCQIGPAGYHVVGNVMAGGPDNCPDYVDFRYNVVAGGGCGSTFRDVGESLDKLYVSDSNDSSKDHHLTGAPGSSAADDYVPTTVPGGCPSSDHEGTARATSGRCDAGAHER